MSARSSRSSNIPIPRTSTSTSPSRNIEDVISLPLSLTRRYSTARGSPEDGRGGLFSRNALADPSTSPVRSGARSYPRSSTMLSRSTPRTPPFEPRIVRAEPSRIDTTCAPTSPTTSSRTHRMSVTGRPSSAHHSSSHVLHLPPVSPPTPFSRPAYLDHAALRHLLRVEPPSLLPPMRKSDVSSYDSRAMSPSTDSDEDSNASPPPVETPIPSDESVLRLPTRWGDSRHQSVSVSADGRDLTFQGAITAANDRDGGAGAARTDFPIPPACGIYYFEVQIHSKLPTAHISIGLTGPDVKVSRLPGWEPNSWGYHGDDGRSFASEKSGTSYGPTYGSDDTIGCGIDFTTGRAFFTKNGILLGSVFEGVGKDVELYPSVGLKHAHDSIRVNLGHEPFKFDIEFHVQTARTNALQGVFNQSLRAEEDDAKATLDNLVMAYLGHHGYTKTLRALQKDAPTPSSLPMDMDTDVPSASGSRGVESRTEIVQAVMSGDIDAAISETQLHHPVVLDADEGIMLFKLRCRKFIELLMESVDLKKARQAEMDVDGEIDELGMDVDVDAEVSPDARYEMALSDALSYGQRLQHDHKGDPRLEVQKTIQKTFGIVAFEDPREAGGLVSEIVSRDARVALANELNQAILRSQGRPPQPALETFYRHTTVCVQQLAMLGAGIAPFVDMKREFIDA